MQTLPVIFGRSYKPISLAIQIRTFCRWSHVGAIMPDGRIIEAVGGQGVVITERRDFEKRYRETMVRHVMCQNTELAYALLNLQIGKRYDNDAFWGVALGTGWDDLCAYQCAELIGSVLGHFDTALLATLVPKDILKVKHAVK
ncbi:hypothetical protein [Alishewanella sp. SMS8]|uniref:hypothetical protein n=1 Tax=Alishewanella sp. SMS8 TaxID=2994676 RepID=UPI0027410B48|nr:hypothetical protein [Alishewanella sp. SMS8]MDP5206340.1 hypothetical protein [Alishewanella sp. SMS9]MDP5459899.1 hypothetical protein [Alishewanella sp. SMS8]